MISDESVDIIVAKQFKLFIFNFYIYINRNIYINMDCKLRPYTP